MEWLRWYHGSVTDPKFPLIARRSGQNVAAVLALWAALLERASMAEVRGSIEGFDCESFDALLGLDDGACQTILSAFEAKEMIVGGCIAKWRERQPARERSDDNSTDRVRLHRERQKALQNKESNDSNANETLCNASNNHETPRLEEIREEEIREDKGTPHTPHRGDSDVGDCPPEFSRFWKAYPKKTGKRAALKAYHNAKGKPPVNELIAILDKQKSWPQWLKDGGQFIPNPATWLNQGRWNDELPEVEARASPSTGPMSFVERENARIRAEIEAIERQEAQNVHCTYPA